MDFFQVIHNRRSIRRYRHSPVSEADLQAILDAARLAPSAENAQPWRFLVVRSPERLRDIAGMVNAMMDQRLSEARDDPTRQRHIRRLRPYSVCFARAPVTVFILLRRSIASPTEAHLSHFDPDLQSVSAATCHLVLAASALGYGSCWATAPVHFAGEELEAMLGVADPWRLVALVSIGVPAQTPTPHRLRPAEETVSFLE